MGWNPLLQLQRYDPRVFTQAPFSQRPEKRRHSSMSKTEMFFRTWSYIRDTCLLKCMLRFKYSLLHIFAKNFLSWRKWQLRDKFPLRCTFTMPKWRKWKNWIRKEKKKRKERKRKNETLFSEIEQLQLTASNLLCRNEYQVIEFATVTQFSDRGWNRTYGLIDINPSLSNQPMKGCTTPPESTPPTLYDQQCGFFYVLQESEQWKSCETEPTVFLPYPRRLELYMSQRRQHILLSFFKTLSVGPAGVWTHDLPLGRPALIQLS